MSPNKFVRSATPALGAALLALSLAACSGNAGKHTSAPEPGSHIQLALLETTDLHSNVLSYDYFKLGADKRIGFERAAELVLAARKQYPNSLIR